MLLALFLTAFGTVALVVGVKTLVQLARGAETRTQDGERFSSWKVEGLPVRAQDLEGEPLEGFRFACGSAESLPTDAEGATELELSLEQALGRSVMVVLVASPEPEDEWFLINAQIRRPESGDVAELVLMRRARFRALAADVRENLRHQQGWVTGVSEAERIQVLEESITQAGLKPDELASAIRAFAETQSLYDRGIAAFLAGEYQQAEELLEGEIASQEGDLVEALRFLGAAQIEQAKHREAETTFRKVVALEPDDAMPLLWVARSLAGQGKWSYAELTMRQVLAILEANYGSEHPFVALTALGLAELLQAANRDTESEPLLRRALAIFETSHEPDHPYLATSLTRLAWRLQETNRGSEAEPLHRRALAIFERIYGSQHSYVARGLVDLATLLQEMDRPSEAEPLLRRALVIFFTASKHDERLQSGLMGVQEDYEQLLRAQGRSEEEVAAELAAVSGEAPSSSVSSAN